MAKRGRKPTLTKLQEKQAELAEQIKELKREERREQVALERQRFAILGRALARELAENPDLAEKLDPLINARVTKVRERQILGLAPLTKSPPAAGQ